MKVTVVVPIYNAGEYVELRAGSLLGQTMPAEDYEVIYVDDGSTDDSAEHLAAIAAAHPNVRVHHQENSGWPGKPRNVGVQLARGEYVQFVDQDDELAPDALAGIYELAARNGADVAFGKSYGRMQGPARIFREHRERCTVADADLFTSLTPHKMFRRQFLLDHDITFPEGRVRLEDQLFLAQAYPRAKVVSVLGDRPTYHWHKREDGGNNSASGLKPDEYYGIHLRNVIREIRANSEPGPLQDRMLARNYRLEILRNASEPRIVKRNDATNQRFLDLVRELAVNEMSPTVGASLPGVQSLRARLLEDGNYEALKAIALQTQKISLDVVTESARWEKGVLHLALAADLRWSDGEPVVVTRTTDGYLLDPRLTQDAPGVDEWLVQDPLQDANGSPLLRDATRHVWWFADPELEPALVRLDDQRHHVRFTGTVRFDARDFAGGRPLEDGTYRWWIQANVLGLHRRLRLVVSPELRAGATAIDRDLSVESPERLLGVHLKEKDSSLEMRLGPIPSDASRFHRLLWWANRDDRRRPWVSRAAALGRRAKPTA